MIRKVFWIGSENNYAQFYCLDLDSWLANFKICLKILSGWPRFVWSHCIEALSQARFEAIK